MLAPVCGHPETGQTYRLYTDASDYAIAGALQQIQYIAIRDLKGMRVHKKLAAAHKASEKVPEWSENWEDMRIPVECVIAYWSRVPPPKPGILPRKEKP